MGMTCSKCLHAHVIAYDIAYHIAYGGGVKRLILAVCLHLEQDRVLLLFTALDDRLFAL